MHTTDLPLTDLHRHLDGNIRAQSILELGQQFSMRLPADNLEDLKPFVQVVENQPDLMAFLQKLDWGVKVLGDLDACRRVAYENVQDLTLAGIDYSELRFSPYYMSMQHQLPIQGVVEAVIDGVQAGCRDFNVKANLIGIMSRTFGQQQCMDELQALLSQKQHLVAIDLAGDEGGQPGELFIEHFKLVRDAGLNVTVHAGEAAGPESVWQAIKELGATRIGHGVNSVKDPHLMEYMAKQNIAIESCLTSNLQTSTVSDIKLHPVKTFLQFGIKATLNTDDPAVQGVDIGNEYHVASKDAGLSTEQLNLLQKNGTEVAFLSDQDKKALFDSKVSVR